MPGFSDLNLNVSNLTPKAIDHLVEYAIRLGYDNLGLAIDYEFPTTDTNNKHKKAEKQKIIVPSPNVYDLPHKLKARLKNTGRNIKIYNRINIKVKSVDINTNLQHLKGKPVQDYDLISLEPLNNQVLLYLCTNNFNADMITINSGIECGLTDKHLIRLIKNAVNAFSLTFEINYSSSISSSIERRDFIMTGRCLTFNTKSKALVISSGTSQKMSLRGPYEILNLVKIFNINDQSAHRILRKSTENLLLNSFCRKHTATGMVYFNEINDLKRLEQALILKRKLITAGNETEDLKKEEESISASPIKKLKI